LLFYDEAMCHLAVTSPVAEHRLGQLGAT